jgi:dolichol-phosphate mannosyltransferase
METMPSVPLMRSDRVEDAGTVLVVVPTYEEVGNVPSLIAALEPVVDVAGIEALIVDDGSPDGTGSIVARLASTRPWLHLLEREKPLGLGSAYRAGFRWALERPYERVGEMDADLSHDPSVIPSLLAELDVGADLALGSRYVPGGGSEGWPLSRRMLSRGANRFARTVLQLSTHDVTSGFRMFSRRAVRLMLETGTRCDGYGFQIEGVYLVERAGGRVGEVPICFRDRRYGSSKMTRAIAFEAATRCLRLAAEPIDVAPLPIAEPALEVARRRGA